MMSSREHNGFDARQLEAIVPDVAADVRRFAPAATTHLEQTSRGYFCASWRLRDRAQRELFVEQAGPDVPPLVLRVGVYFADSVAVTRDPEALRVALETLTQARRALQSIGAVPTFTEGPASRDDMIFGWTDDDLRDWLTRKSDNRDLVWLWDLHSGIPEQSKIQRAVHELLPVWRALNALD